VSAPGTQSADGLLARAIPRYFELGLYLLVLTGFLTLVSTHGLDAPSTLFVAAALIVRGYVLATNRTLLIRERWTSGLTIAYVAFYVLDYFLLSQQFVSTTVHLVLFLTVMRLFSARRDRDHYFLAVIAFLMVLASAVLTVDSTFLFAFSIFMLFAIATFVLLEMKRTSAKSTVSAEELNHGKAERRLVISLAGIAPAILLLILLTATAIFFVLPRLSTGYLSAFSASGAISTGFSDHVELGNIGEIQQSNTVVMHVEIVGDERGTYTQKWRAVALSVFDGTSWSNP
jgi:protein-glutamine gamma-glutamyltransferase